MRLARSLSFRLALLYAGLFGTSVLLLGGLYYWVAIARPLDGVQASLREEAATYRRLFEREGVETLALALERRAADPSPRMAYHALLSGEGETVTANLPSWPASQGDSWIRIEADIARQGDEDEYEAMVFDQSLPSGGRLMLGRDIEDLDELEEGIKDTAIWLLPALLLLALIGGALMSRAIGRRLDSVSAAARAVIDGDLSKRIALHGTNDDFDRLGETLNLMLDRIEEALEAVRRVSDSVVHELRTPMARLHSTLVGLQAEVGDEAAAEALEESARLGTVIYLVLRIARLEAGRHELEFAPVDMSALIEDAVELYNPEAEQRRQRLSAAIAPELIVAGDRDLLFQAVANLLDNAVKFTPDGAGIDVEATREGNEVRLRIEDEGPGAPADLLKRLPERFFRGPGTGAVPGLGLGLSLVAAVAKAHRSNLNFSMGQKGLRVDWRFRAEPFGGRDEEPA